jgi:pimeloyl-ACP methyl ester carboxylesterase
MSQNLTLPDGTRLAYADQGTGIPLLCLPGLTRTMADFTYVKPHLLGRMVRMDYRGRGGSSWTGAATYTVLQEATDALALMDHLGIRQFAVLGTSRGGLIGMLLAHLAKDRLLGLCLNDIGPELIPEGLGRIADYRRQNLSGLCRGSGRQLARFCQCPRHTLAGRGAKARQTKR